MSNETLTHYGKKGMKWGVRNDRGHEGEQASEKTIAKADKKYQKSFKGMAGFAKVHNEFAGQMNQRLDVLNKTFAGKDVGKPGSKNYNDYHKGYEKAVSESVTAAMKTFGTNASGTGRVKLEKVGKGEDSWYTAYWEDIKHADEPMPRFKIIPRYDEKGFIVTQTVSLIKDEDVSHEDLATDFLAHFGVVDLKKTDAYRQGSDYIDGLLQHLNS